MAVTELDSFVTKFKSLWASEHKAKLTLDSRNGNVWVTEDVAITAGVVENTTKADASVPEVVCEDTLATIEKGKEDLEEINKLLKKKVKGLSGRGSLD